MHQLKAIMRQQNQNPKTKMYLELRTFWSLGCDDADCFLIGMKTNLVETIELKLMKGQGSENL